jgi:hypothetical protein
MEAGVRDTVFPGHVAPVTPVIDAAGEKGDASASAQWEAAETGEEKTKKAPPPVGPLVSLAKMLPTLAKTAKKNLAVDGVQAMAGELGGVAAAAEFARDIFLQDETAEVRAFVKNAQEAQGVQAQQAKEEAQAAANPLAALAAGAK